MSLSLNTRVVYVHLSQHPGGICAPLYHGGYASSVPWWVCQHCTMVGVPNLRTMVGVPNLRTMVGIDQRVSHGGYRPACLPWWVGSTRATGWVGSTRATWWVYTSWYICRVLWWVYTSWYICTLYTTGYTTILPSTAAVRASSPAHAEVPASEALGSTLRIIS